MITASYLVTTILVVAYSSDLAMPYSSVVIFSKIIFSLSVITIYIFPSSHHRIRVYHFVLEHVLGYLCQSGRFGLLLIHYF